MVHGFGANRHAWDPLLPRLAERHEVLRVDLTGFGDAPKPRGGPYGPEAQARRIVALILEHDLRDAVLVGHSLGGGVALLAALMLQGREASDASDGSTPGRLAGMVLISAAAYEQPLPPFARLAESGWPARAALAVLPKRALIRAVFRSVVHDAAVATPERAEALAYPLREREGRVALLNAARRIVPRDIEAWTDRYHELDIPCLLIWGREDRVVRLRFGERLSRELPDADLVVIERCGHLPQEERPGETLQRIEEFLERLTGGAG